MNTELKTKWVEALRSGKFEQGKRALRRGATFCCLGVRCEVMGAKWDEGDDIDLNAKINEEPQEYYLSSIALETAGMTDRQQEILYTMNDEGSSFKEIADHIEAEL